MLNFTDPLQREGYTAVHCGVMLGKNYYAIPLLNSYGADDYYPKYCDCADGMGLAPKCQTFDFLSGLLFFPFYQDQTSEANLAIIELVTSVVPTYQYNFSSLAYNAMFAGANVGNTSLAPYFNSAEYRAQAYDWCAMAAGNCSILSINSVDTLNTAVNSYYYQLPNGSCSNSLTSPNFQRLVDTPPVNLTTPYLECRESADQALVDAAGIAVEFTLLALPFITLLLVHIVLLSQYLAEKFNYRMYTRIQRDQLMDLLSLELLLARDRKLGPIDDDANADKPDISPQQKLFYDQLLSEMRTSMCVNGDYTVLAATQSGVHGFKDSLKLGDNFAQQRFIEKDIVSPPTDTDPARATTKHRFQCIGAHSGDIALSEFVYPTGGSNSVAFVTFYALEFTATADGCIECSTLTSLCPQRSKDMYGCMRPPWSVLQTVVVRQLVGGDVSMGYLRWSSNGKLQIHAGVPDSTDNDAVHTDDQGWFKTGVSYAICQFTFCYEL